MYAVILAGSSGTRQHPLRAKDDPVSLRPTEDGWTLLRRIGDLIAQRFGVSHSFVDIPNPV